MNRETKKSADIFSSVGLSRRAVLTSSLIGGSAVVGHELFGGASSAAVAAKTSVGTSAGAVVETRFRQDSRHLPQRCPRVPGCSIRGFNRTSFSLYAPAQGGTLEQCTRCISDGSRSSSTPPRKRQPCRIWRQGQRVTGRRLPGCQYIYSLGQRRSKAPCHVVAPRRRLRLWVRYGFGIRWYEPRPHLRRGRSKH